ncbi:MAG TPA: hypothetical protein QF710_02225 [Candidatus Nitrosopelagicus sp.]|nr:hypothetical protein [Candidatus Nitrosopelagicus sp.]
MLNFCNTKRYFFQPSRLSTYTVNIVMSKIFIPIRPSRSTSEVDELDEAEED